ncbi:hypothetical protein COCNU_13G008030 [Cocos nucifera]|uniref:Uncharacterized protein n=1 Tax=Cocos nucifera TaxID=13894 RepID=A0A8K0IUC0_COCNU|nr:hypothetical protein COCNU_13G008030 [Cocos nucifera]
MDPSQFMDKQVTVPSGRSRSGDLFHPMDPQEERQKNGGVFAEEILLSYDFQPIRTVGSWPPINAGLDGASKKIGSSSLGFMDKQVTVLSGISQSGNLFDLIDLQEERQNNGGVFTVEEILPSYDFQPIRTVGSWPPINAGLDGASKKMSSSSLRAYLL